MRRDNQRVLLLDAKNRALRSFLQGVAIDLAVAIALFLLTVFKSANAWGDLELAILTFTLAKTVVQTVASFVMRRFLDPSSIPTPLPPAPSGEPNEDV